MSNLAHASEHDKLEHLSFETPEAARWRREREREWKRVHDWRWAQHWAAIVTACEEAEEEARRDLARLRARIALGEVALPHERWADHRVLRRLASADWSYVVIAAPKFNAALGGTFARVRIDGTPEASR